MPIAEIKTDDQREKLSKLMEDRKSTGEMEFVSNAFEWDEDHTFHSLFYFKREPFVVKTTGEDISQVVEIGYSETREEELKEAGVIFDEKKEIKRRLARASEQTEAEIRQISPRLVDRLPEVDHLKDFLEDTKDAERNDRGLA